MVFRKKRHRGDPKHKFCPVCGTKLETSDAFCTNCNYSFLARSKKHKNHGIKPKRILALIIILIVIYLGIRYFNGQSLVPDIGSLLNLTKNITG